MSSDFEVRIVKLEPKRVASAYGFGPSPEGKAWDILLPWAQEKGLLDDPQTHRFFGFNNPDPSPGSPNYGYEQWVVVAPNAEPEGELRVVDFCGGLYAVARCEGLHNIGRVWKQLALWREESKYHHAHHQWLEEVLDPVEPQPEKFVFDLYLPIVE